VVRIDRLFRMLLSDPRVDQVLWCSRLTRPGADGYSVATHRGRLEFWCGEQGEAPHARDEYGTVWSWRGDPRVLGLEREGDRLVAPDYPNLLERVAGALDTQHSGEVWVTARPGCEFEVPGGAAHVGGASHGALHLLDSASLLIVAGGPRRVDPGRPFRSVDIAPLCAELLGMPMRYRVGDPRPPRRYTNGA
jgi:hypothetical protein